MPKFSIIIPLYNKEAYVCKALESVVAQTYRDFELIIVDDGSTDNSADVVRELVIGNSKLVNDQFRLISQPNSGVAAARNNGVKASCGEYVCFLDADDWWEPTFLEEMDKLISEYPDAGIYATNYIYYKPGKTHVALNLSRGYINYPEAYAKNLVMPVTSITTCMPRRVFDEMGGFPVGIKLGEDFLLWAKTALHYKVAYCEKPLAYYNNDIPASMRATRNLHAPKYHMLFHLDEIEGEIGERTSQVTIGRGEPLQGIGAAALQESWKALLDKLRVSGLMDFWLSDEYHAAAEVELKKVDWSKQSKSAQRQYKMPIWLMRAKSRFMQIGSLFKQRIIKFILKQQYE